MKRHTYNGTLRACRMAWRALGREILRALPAPLAGFLVCLRIAVYGR